MHEFHTVALLSFLSYAVAVTAGIFASRYVNRLVNVLLMLQVYQWGMVVMIFVTNGVFRPILLVPGIFIWAALSPAGLIPPLLFLAVAILANHRCVQAQTPRT
jgi:hypothetical protein